MTLPVTIPKKEILNYLAGNSTIGLAALLASVITGCEKESLLDKDPLT